MNTSLFPLAGMLSAFLIAPLHSQSLGIPVLSTPGTATWISENIATGTRTVFTISANSVFDWNGFNLPTGSELVFDFVGGDSVVNMLNGTGANVLAGNVTSNGNVGFFSPNADLIVTGNVTAKSVTLAALDVDAAAFNSGGTFTMTKNGFGFNGLTVVGQIKATDGDVVLAGRSVDVGVAAKVHAKDSVLIAGGTKISVGRSGGEPRLKQNSDDGFVLHMGESRAARIEVAAGKQINNQGRLDTGSKSNRIFLEIGKNGQLVKNGSGIMVGKTSINGKVVDKKANVDPNEGDSAAGLSTSMLKLPALKKPGGQTAANSRTVVNNTPMSANADGGRDRKRPSQQVASSGNGSKPMLQRTSFFGMRGGDSTAKR